MKLLTVMCLVLVCCRTATARTVHFYVSPAGSNRWTGRTLHAGKDGAGPLRTPAAALRAVQGYLAGHASRQCSLEIDIAPGAYTLRTGLQIELAKNCVQLRIRALKTGTALLSGGPALHSWTRSLPASAAALFDSQALPHIIGCSLSAQNIQQTGALHDRGFGGPTPVCPAELFYYGQRMQLARWPEKGFLLTANPVSANETGFTADLPANMEKDPDLWVHGYWNFDWADTTDPVAHLDAAAHTLTIKKEANNYGYKPQRRFFFLNAPQGLLGPGEYYLDKAAGMLYFWPPAGFEAAAVRLSLLKTPLITILNSSHVTLQGLVLQCGRADGVLVQGGGYNLLQQCTLRGIGLNGAVLLNSPHSGLEGCAIHDTGDGGVVMQCGDRTTLTPGHDFVSSCRIHDYAQIDYTYHAGVAVGGVGNRVDHNEIYNAPHQAIAFSGNNQQIEYNNIHNVCLQTGDAGAIYNGRDTTQRGAIVRCNYFHNILTTLHTPGNYDDVVCVYLDDCLSGTTIERNYFVNTSHSILIGGGRDNTVSDNLFVHCSLAVSIDARGLSWAANWFQPGGTIMRRLLAMPYNRPPYSTQYPHLANILHENIAAPDYNVVAGNLIVNSPQPWLQKQSIPAGSVTLQNNHAYTTGELDNHLSLGFLPGFSALNLPPMRSIGPQTPVAAN